jgi:RimJ/RimL family protein N-acetyltransferase
LSALEAVSEANAAETIAYLARAPYDNVFVQGQIASGALGREGDAYLTRDASGAVDGVCYYGPQFVPQAADDAPLTAFARHAASLPAPRMIVGPRRCVEVMYRELAGRWRGPRLVRASQPVYVLDRAHLLGSRSDADVGRALPSEADEIARQSALMIAGEFGRPPSSPTAELKRRTRDLIDAGKWWRYRVGGRLVYQCNVGSSTPQTAQLQGVWTPLAERGRGYARRGMAAICDFLLDEHPTLCLYVNDFNLAAIELYERVGFTRVSEFSTLFF